MVTTLWYEAQGSALSTWQISINLYETRNSLMAVLHIPTVKLKCSNEDMVIISQDNKSQSSLIRFILKISLRIPGGWLKV